MTLNRRYAAPLMGGAASYLYQASYTPCFIDKHYDERMVQPSKIFPAIFWLKLYKIPTLTRGCVRLKANRSRLAWQHFTFPQVVRLLT